MPLGDYVWATHPASFFTALPLSTAGRVINIHEGAGGCKPEAGGGWAAEIPPGCWSWSLCCARQLHKWSWVSFLQSDVNLKRIKQVNTFCWQLHLASDESTLIDILFHNLHLYKYWWIIGTHLCLKLACSWPFSGSLVHWLQTLRT